ncbi:MAG: Rrf2 family protein [Myxococcota bacterium]
MKLTAQEEYGLRCLLQVARTDEGTISLRQIAAAEGLSVEYAGKLVRVLRLAGLVRSERGAHGGYALARPAGAITTWDALSALDGPLHGDNFCETHRGRGASCVHAGGGCSIRTLWSWVDDVLEHALSRVTLNDLLEGESTVSALLPAADAIAAGGTR